MIEQPNIEAQNELNSILENLTDYASIRKRVYRIKWLHAGTVRKISRIMLKEGNDAKVNYQTAACIILNGFLKIKFFYPILWRWFYYVKQYSEADLTEVLAIGKKKIPLESYYMNTILTTGMTDTMMAMTKKEVYSIRQGQGTAQHGTTIRNTDG